MIPEYTTGDRRGYQDHMTYQTFEDVRKHDATVAEMHKWWSSSVTREQFLERCVCVLADEKALASRTRVHGQMDTWPTILRAVAGELERLQAELKGLQSERSRDGKDASFKDLVMAKYEMVRYKEVTPEEANPDCERCEGTGIVELENSAHHPGIHGPENKANRRACPACTQWQIQKALYDQMRDEQKV